MSVQSTESHSRILEVDGTTTTVATEHDGPVTWVDVQREHDWTFRVENVRARLVDTDADEPCPDWLRTLLLQLGVKEVVVE